MENASYAIQGLKLRVPDELDKLGIKFSKMAISDRVSNEKAKSEEKAEPTQLLPALPAQLKCGFCGVVEDDAHKLQVCSRCKQMAYCSREHQRSHWQVHKPDCKEK